MDLDKLIYQKDETEELKKTSSAESGNALPLHITEEKEEQHHLEKELINGLLASFIGDDYFSSFFFYLTLGIGSC